MATIVNTPAHSESTGFGWVVGIALMILAVLLFLVLVPRVMQWGETAPAVTNPNTGTGRDSGISIPDQIDVTIDTPQEGAP